MGESSKPQESGLPEWPCDAKLVTCIDICYEDEFLSKEFIRLRTRDKWFAQDALALVERLLAKRRRAKQLDRALAECPKGDTRRLARLTARRNAVYDDVRDEIARVERNYDSEEVVERRLFSELVRKRLIPPELLTITTIGDAHARRQSLASCFNCDPTSLRYDDEIAREEEWRRLYWDHEARRHRMLPQPGDDLVAVVCRFYNIERKRIDERWASLAVVGLLLVCIFIASCVLFTVLSMFR